MVALFVLKRPSFVYFILDKKTRIRIVNDYASERRDKNFLEKLKIHLIIGTF